MPQMMPLNWLSLMIIFITIFFLFNNANYYSFLYKTKKNMINMTLLKNIWKW